MFDKSFAAYESWKDRFLSFLKNMSKNFEHIEFDEEILANEELIQKYIFKLNSLPFYYESLVCQIFK